MRISAALAGLPVALAVLACAVLLLVDTYSTSSCTESGCIESSSTLVEENGAWVLALMAVPLVLALGAAAAIHLRAPRGVEWVTVGLLLVGCLVAITSVGLFFLPTAVLLLIAVARDARTPAGA